MVISKILEGTLNAGQSSISFTDSDFPNSLIRVYSSNADIIPVSRTLTGTTLTVVYEAQDSNLGVAVEIVKDGMTINDTLTSDATDEALSAKQGKLLKDDLDTLSNTVDNLDIPDNITDLDDVNVTSIQDGQILAWDAVLQKFVNVNQSGGNSEVYTTDEQLIGSYLGENLYRKVIPITQDWNFTANTWVKSNIPQGSIKSIINGRLQITFNDTYSLHYVQLGFIDNVIAGNCFRAFSAFSGGANLIVEYTKTS